ncbi:MAG: acyltransferase [Treponema sp.]|jgi:peptidoglycan/LPS O-acetylase OafA/YrhL|nr:acyltransferase [Treponema sp.]
MAPEENKRIPGFDALRFFMVLLVIVMHASMTFMEYVPRWWYVQDDQKYLFFTFLVILLDRFPMTLLFFLAGYFSPPSFARRGFRSFLTDKVKRIGFPWLAGVFLVAPFFAYLSYENMVHRAVSIGEFTGKLFFGEFYQQAHYWFLGVLLFLFLLYSLYGFMAGKTAASKNRIARTPVIAAAWIVSIAAYYMSSTIKHADSWLNIGYVLYFQPARAAGYVMVFALGIYAYKKSWYTQNGWTPKWVFWGVIDAVVMGFSVVWVMIGGGFGETANRAVNSFLYNTTAVVSTLFLTGLFYRFQKKLGKLTEWFSPYSYGIYWLHSIALTVILRALKPLAIAGAVKWFVSITATLVICQTACKYILPRRRPGVPGARRVV